MIKIQTINFPVDCQIMNHDVYNYDPTISFNESNSKRYLNEDLLQCSFPESDIIIDLGWYGDVVTNKGEFRIYIIKNENWQVPFNVVHSKSLEETLILLTNTMQYFTSVVVKEE